MSGILSPAFLQSAGRPGKVQPTPPTPFSGIKLISVSDDLMLGLNGTDITVVSTKNGQPHTETYASVNDSILIYADENTETIITGNITGSLDLLENIDLKSLTIINTEVSGISGLNCYTLQELNVSENSALNTLNCSGCQILQELNLSANTALTELYCNNCYILKELDLSTSTALTNIECNGCYSLQELNLSTNTALTSIDCGNCYSLQELNVSKNSALNILYCSHCCVLQELNLSTNTALTYINCGDCYYLQELNLSANTALTDIDCSSCYSLQELNLSTNTALTSLTCGWFEKTNTIYYPGTNSDVSTAIANAITDANIDNGTVYTDSAGAYYSTIADAATAKGWTIEQLS